MGFPSNEDGPTLRMAPPILESPKRISSRDDQSYELDDGRRTMTYFTIGDFILLIPMALAGALFLGAIPAMHFKNNVLRVFGALLGVLAGLPARRRPACADIALSGLRAVSAQARRSVPASSLITDVPRGTSVCVRARVLTPSRCTTRGRRS